MVIGRRPVKTQRGRRERGPGRGTAAAPCARRALSLGFAAPQTASTAKFLRSMRSFVILIDTVIEIYIWILIASAVLSWLVAFGGINTYNRLLATGRDPPYRPNQPLPRP